jgi:cyclase
LINDLSKHFGSQAIIASIDVRKTLFGGQKVFTLNGTRNTFNNPITWAKKVEEMGAGEILLTSIDHEGTWNGFDYELVQSVADAVSIPVIAHGGAGTIEHIQNVVKESHASAVALGSMVVFQKKGMGVLVNFPDKRELGALMS